MLQAAGMGKPSDLLVLKMGEQVRMVDLVEDFVRLSGFESGKEIQIAFTGIRPGEKLSETSGMRVSKANGRASRYGVRCGGSGFGGRSLESNGARAPAASTGGGR